MIEQHLKNIEAELELIREKLAPYAKITSAYWQDGKIVVEFETNTDIDIRYWFGDKVHEAEDYIDEIDQSRGRFEIGVNQFDKDWWVQVFGEQVESEPYNVGAYAQSEIPEIIFDFLGWWDTMMEGESFDDFPFANAVKIDADNLSQAINSEAEYVIPFLGFRDADLESDHTIRKRIQGQTNGWDNLDLSKIAVVILDDEPTYDKEIQEQIVRVFKEEYPDLKGTFSYSGNYIIAEKTLAGNLSDVHVNIYPFMEEGYSSFWGHIDSREKFHAAFDKFMERLRSVSPEGVTFTITMQTFAMKFDGDAFEWKRTIPPPESPIWYAEAMTRHGIAGGLSYMYKTYKNEDLIAKDMPELLESVKKVYESIE